MKIKSHHKINKPQLEVSHLLHTSLLPSDFAYHAAIYVLAMGEACQNNFHEKVPGANACRLHLFVSFADPHGHAGFWRWLFVCFCFLTFNDTCSK